MLAIILLSNGYFKNIFFKKIYWDNIFFTF
jgi:hypothetical protein